MAENVGMMSGAYFVGKGELLAWINDFFGEPYTKVEQCATGALHCLIADSIFQRKVPLHKVNFNAKFDYEYIANFKVLQDVFKKQKIDKSIPVDRLVKAKYQDNLEFLQWMKNLWDVRYGGEDYDAQARKEAAMERYASGRKFASKKAGAPKLGGTGMARAGARASAGRAGGIGGGAARGARTGAGAGGAKRATGGAARRSAGGARKSGGAAREAKVDEETAQQLAELRGVVEGLEKERDFYFGKLRAIEVLCQEEEDGPEKVDKAKVIEILYSTDENEEFEPPDEDNEEEEDNGGVDDPEAEDFEDDEDATF